MRLKEQYAQWDVKYSRKYDAFYFKNTKTMATNWEDPRPALEDHEIQDVLYGAEGSVSGGQGQRQTSLDKIRNGVKSAHLVTSDSDTDASNESDDGNGTVDTKGSIMWEEKWSKKHGMPYYKNKISGAISWEHQE